MNVMYQLSKYFLPAACFLLLAAFFMLLPDLRCCTLRRGAASRRLQKADVLLMALLTVIYAVPAFSGLGNTRSPQSFANMEGKTAAIRLDPCGRTRTAPHVIATMCGALFVCLPAL